jgi:hypothetical protein
MDDIKITDAEVLKKCPDNKSLIFFVDVTAEIRNAKNPKKFSKFTAEKIVVKGTLEEIYKNDQTKKKFIREIFKFDSGVKSKVQKFDLSKIKITNVKIIRSLGYGIKQS